MDGYQLLKEVKQKHPDTIRLILSGYSVEKLLISALQNSLARIYLFKPWDNKRLVRIIEQALEVEEILSSEKLLKLIGLFKGTILGKDVCKEAFILKEESKAAQKYIDRVNKSRAQDSRALTILNSSFWEVQYSSIEEALNRFSGFNIKNITIVDIIFRCISKANPNEKIELELEHATLSNRIVDIIYKRLLNKELSEMNAVAGLMHDIGRYLLFGMQSEFKKIMMEADVSPQELGGYILNKCELTYPVIESALFNHCPMDKRIANKEIVAVVHIASYYAGFITGSAKKKSIDEGVFEHLGFKKKDCDKVIAEVVRDIEC